MIVCHYGHENLDVGADKDIIRAYLTVGEVYYHSTFFLEDIVDIILGCIVETCNESPLTIPSEVSGCAP